MPSPKASKSTPLVLVSATPYVTLVSEIAGDLVEARSCVPEDVDPHNWESTVQDRYAIKGAKIWFTIGESFEGRLSKNLKAEDPNTHFVDLADPSFTLKDPHHHCHHCESHDTHFWLSYPVLLAQADIITKELSHLLPEHADTFVKNYRVLEARLTTLHDENTKLLKEKEHLVIVTSHSAYTYFCKDYHLRQVTVEPSGGREARTKDMQRVLSEVKQEHSSIIGMFTQPQHVNRATVLIANKLHLPEYSVNPYAANYVQTIQDLVSIVASYEPHVNSEQEVI